MKTTEGIEFWAFVSDPKDLGTDTPTLCNGLSVKEWLDKKFSSRCNFGTDNLVNGFYKEGGWCFDLKPYMKKYIYTCYGNIYSAYAPSVKALRTVRSIKRFEKVALAPKGF